MNTETRVPANELSKDEECPLRQCVADGRIGVWSVVRDFLSCFRLPRSLYGEPTDNLTSYARAIALYGVDSEEARELLRRNSGNEYFRSRAEVLAKCKDSLDLRNESSKHERGAGSGNPVTAGEYARILFSQSADIALIDPDFTPSPELAENIGGLLRIAEANCPSLDRVGLFVRRPGANMDLVKQQCVGLAKAIPRKMAVHVFYTQGLAWSDVESPEVLTDQGGFEYTGKELTCKTYDYRLVSPERHVVQWRRVRDGSPDLGLVGEFDIQGESDDSVNAPQTVLDL